MFHRRAMATKLPAMALTEKQRADLEALGVANVQMKLGWFGPGRDTTIGFVTGGTTRGDVEDWLAETMAERDRLQAEHQAETLRLAKLAAEQQVVAVRWAKIAGWAAGLGILVSIVIAVLQWLGPK